MGRRRSSRPVLPGSECWRPAGWIGGADKDTVVEIRSTGAQTVFPGSVHPEGEPITWQSQGSPALIDTAVLTDAARRLHAAAVLLFAIRNAVSAVRPDCAYDTWIKIGMALHAWDADAGLRVWNEWSSRGAQKYHGLAELESHWRSFREDGAIHLGTLFHVAEEAGWQRLPRLGLYYSGPGAASAPGAEGGPDDWDSIIPFDAAEYGPPLPLEVLPPALRDFVETTAESKQVPAEMPALLALGAVAAAAAKRFEVIVGKTHHEQLNIFGLAAMDSGERKSPTAAAAFAPLEAYQEQLAKAATPKILRATEAREIEETRLVELRRKAAKEEDPTERARFTEEALDLAVNLTEVPAAPRLLCGDVTPEALAVLLASQGGRMLQYDTEGGVFFNVIGGMYTKTGVTSLDVHLKGYTGEVVRFDRTTRVPVTVTKPALTLMLTTQPDQLKRLQRVEELKGRGLLARFAYVLPHPMVGYRLEMELLPHVVDMETRGFPVDRDALQRHLDSALHDRDAAATRLRGLFGNPHLNPASNPQLKAALAAKGIAVESTAEAALIEAKDETFIPAILAYRSAAKRGSQAERLLKAIQSDDRIHARFEPTGTHTGRFSSRDPNLQNIERGGPAMAWTW